jgi:2-keto-3-deoxy-L-rhamnonate aldolase RhmA
MLRDVLRIRPVFGAIIRTPSAELVETLSSGGLDFVLLDHMHSPASWETASSIARTAKASGLTAFYRPNCAPDLGGSPAYLAAQCSRALSIGFDGLFVPVESVADARAVTSTAERFWQRKLHAPSGRLSSSFAEVKRKIREGLFIVAQFESLAALEELPGVAEVDGIDALAVANSDITVEVTGGLDAQDGRVVDVIQRVEAVCRKHGLALWCNTGYGYPSAEEMVARAAQLTEAGARLVLFQSAEFILSNAIRSIVGAVQSLPLKGQEPANDDKT